MVESQLADLFIIMIANHGINGNYESPDDIFKTSACWHFQSCMKYSADWHLRKHWRPSKARSKTAFIMDEK